MSNRRSIAVCAVTFAFVIGQVSGATFQYVIEGEITSNTIPDLDFPVGSRFEMHFSYSNDACDDLRGCEAPFGSMIGADEEIFTFVGEHFFSSQSFVVPPGSTYYGVIVEDFPSSLDFTDEVIVGTLNEFDFGWYSDATTQNVRNGYVPDGEEVGGFITLRWDAGPSRYHLGGTIDSITAIPEPTPLSFLVLAGILALISRRNR